MPKPDNCPIPPPDMVVENAQFVYRPNFEGREERFNDEGHRYFNLLIPANILEAVQRDGWLVKWTKPKDEREPEPFVEVHIGFKYRPPQISVVQDDRISDLTEQTCGLVDEMPFEKFDVVVRGRAWENDNGCGIKAWLKTFVGVVETDDVQRKYAHLRGE